MRPADGNKQTDNGNNNAHAQAHGYTSMVVGG